jgi:actin-like ATPase involved in cell morphogenesis
VVQISVGTETIFVVQQKPKLFLLKPQIIAFRSTDKNFVFSDIPHENKQSLFCEKIRSINPT